MYELFKTEYLELCSKFGRDTNRKIKNDLKKDVNELMWRIEVIKPQLELKGFAMLLGELHTKRHLRKYEQELMYSNQLISEL